MLDRKLRAQQCAKHAQVKSWSVISCFILFSAVCRKTDTNTLVALRAKFHSLHLHHQGSISTTDYICAAIHSGFESESGPNGSLTVRVYCLRCADVNTITQQPSITVQCQSTQGCKYAAEEYSQSANVQV